MWPWRSLRKPRENTPSRWTTTGASFSSTPRKSPSITAAAGATFFTPAKGRLRRCCAIALDGLKPGWPGMVPGGPRRPGKEKGSHDEQVHRGCAGEGRGEAGGSFRSDPVLAQDHFSISRHDDGI